MTIVKKDNETINEAIERAANEYAENIVSIFYSIIESNVPSEYSNEDWYENASEQIAVENLESTFEAAKMGLTRLDKYNNSAFIKMILTKVRDIQYIKKWENK